MKTTQDIILLMLADIVETNGLLDEVRRRLGLEEISEEKYEAILEEASAKPFM